MTSLDGIAPELIAKRSGLEEVRVRAIVEGRWTPSPRERQAIAASLEQPTHNIAWGHRSPVEHLYGPS